MIEMPLVVSGPWTREAREQVDAEARDAEALLDPEHPPRP